MGKDATTAMYLPGGLSAKDKRTGATALSSRLVDECAIRPIIGAVLGIDAILALAICAPVYVLNGSELSLLVRLLVGPDVDFLAIPGLELLPLVACLAYLAVTLASRLHLCLAIQRGDRAAYRGYGSEGNARERDRPTRVLFWTSLILSALAIDLGFAGKVFERAMVIGESMGESLEDLSQQQVCESTLVWLSLLLVPLALVLLVMVWRVNRKSKRGKRGALARLMLRFPVLSWFVCLILLVSAPALVLLAICAGAVVAMVVCLVIAIPLVILMIPILDALMPKQPYVVYR